MGGLVARYYIENIVKDENVRKLITVDTPHWGAGLANGSSLSGINHFVCDHDLNLFSKMYGGVHSQWLLCNPALPLLPCASLGYELTDELNYSCERLTDYYAIAGIDYDALYMDDNDCGFEISTDYNTFDDIRSMLLDKTYNKLYKELDVIDVLTAGDNIVGFLSQIGCTETLTFRL